MKISFLVALVLLFFSVQSSHAQLTRDQRRGFNEFQKIAQAESTSDKEIKRAHEIAREIFDDAPLTSIIPAQSRLRRVLDNDRILYFSAKFLHLDALTSEPIWSLATTLDFLGGRWMSPRKFPWLNPDHYAVHIAVAVFKKYPSRVSVSNCRKLSEVTTHFGRWNHPLRLYKERTSRERVMPAAFEAYLACRTHKNPNVRTAFDPGGLFGARSFVMLPPPAQETLLQIEFGGFADRMSGYFPAAGAADPIGKELHSQEARKRASLDTEEDFKHEKLKVFYWLLIYQSMKKDDTFECRVFASDPKSPSYERLTRDEIRDRARVQFSMAASSVEKEFRALGDETDVIKKFLKLRVRRLARIVQSVTGQKTRIPDWAQLDPKPAEDSESK